VVNFKKRLSGKKTEKAIDPVKLYDTLDRAHDKGPLRPAQLSVLSNWFDSHRDARDVIVKLHTGQGKTLIGLLMLQARLNDKQGPAVYLCPDNFLIEQTCEQARQFGIATCMADPDLPDEFFNSKKILVTSVQKLFNGLTKFGLNQRSEDVGTILMDDAHTCADRIRKACSIRISKSEQTYSLLKTLFADDLEQQGIGTYADISNHKRDAILPVPYWAWLQHESDVARILSSQAQTKSVKYAWPLLRDMLRHCQCVISGEAIEIEPYIPPLNAFGSFWSAPHRIFMSATVTDDAFLVKGLQLKPETIIDPITYEKERWSGEKMILLPSIIDERLERAQVVSIYAEPDSIRKYGHVVLTPSFLKTQDWAAYGAIVAKSDTLPTIIDNLQNGQYEKTVVLANRYDGIDLPDTTCRVLIFDGKPYSESLVDMHQESCRPDSDATLMRAVRAVEQGLGRSVRGEKDYSVAVITGTDITKLVRDKNSRKYLSPQMATQIEIGLDLADMAQQEIEDGEHPVVAFSDLVGQCLRRDEDWKAYYVEQMENVKPAVANERILRIYADELTAENACNSGDNHTAIDTIQKLLDSGNVDDNDKSWYLQEIARYQYLTDRPESQKLQSVAHRGNRLLLKPPTGVTVSKLTLVSQGRVERITDWIGEFEDYSQLEITLSDILGSLVFGAKADRFERALDDLSSALGFAGERPDKEWKEGPDNLWALDDTHYIVWECKNEVGVDRAEINKREAEQMNRSSAWFEKHYPGLKVRRIMIHPARNVESAASFTHDVDVMSERQLVRFVRAVRGFFKSFESVSFNDLSKKQVQKLLNSYKLDVDDIANVYSIKPKNLKSR